MLNDRQMDKKDVIGNSLVVQWLGVHAFTAQGLGSIPGWGTKILQDARCGQKQRKEKGLRKRRCDKCIQWSVT